MKELRLVLPDDAWLRIKNLGAAEGKTDEEIVIEAIGTYARRARKRRRRTS